MADSLTAEELVAFQDLLRELRKPALTEDEAEALKQKAKEQWREDLQRRISEMQQAAHKTYPDKKQSIFQIFRERFGVGRPTVPLSGAIPGTSVIPGEDHTSFRDRMKIEDQDLMHNIGVVHDGVRHYFKSASYPAPHCPKRVAVLLRKRKLFAEEVEFLETFANLFSDGNGSLYGELAERAGKAQAIWDRHRQR